MQFSFYVGIDVSKNFLDLAVRDGGRAINKKLCFIFL